MVRYPKMHGADIQKVKLLYKSGSNTYSSIQRDYEAWLKVWEDVNVNLNFRNHDVFHLYVNHYFLLNYHEYALNYANALKVQNHMLDL